MLHQLTFPLSPSSSSSSSMDPYDRLVWEVWLPKLRTLMLSWSSRVCDPMVQLLEYWCPLLPSWIMENILDQLVLPKLQVEQEAWDPTTDIMPIHKWIHPWLPLMGKCVLQCPPYIPSTGTTSARISRDSWDT